MQRQDPLKLLERMNVQRDETLAKSGSGRAECYVFFFFLVD